MELKHIDVIQGQTALLQDFWSGIGRPERENNPDMSVCHERDRFKERERERERKCMFTHLNLT